MDFDAIDLRAEAAHDEVVRLCTEHDARWRMTIPADPSRDSDLIFSAVIDDVQRLLAEVRRLRATVDDAARMVGALNRES